MKTILVPVDFTITSRNALLYALFINHHIKAEIIIFHAYNVPAYETDITLEIAEQSVREEMLNELQEWKIDAESRYPEMKISTHLSDALTREEIIDEELNLNADLIVIGTQGTDGLAGVFLIDTVAAAEHTRCPVLIIPPGVILGNLQKIVFATNFEEDDIQNINTIIEVAR
ncbi:MAG: universal stress protein, partial [Bacteroidota bacterium]